MYKRKNKFFVRRVFMEILIRNVIPEELNTLDKEKFDWYSDDDTYNNIIIVGEDKECCNAALYAIGRPLID